MVNNNGGLDSFPVHIEINIAVMINFVKATNSFMGWKCLGGNWCACKDDLVTFMIYFHDSKK